MQTVLSFLVGCEASRRSKPGSGSSRWRSSRAACRCPCSDLLTGSGGGGLLGCEVGLLQVGNLLVGQVDLELEVLVNRVYQAAALRFDYEILGTS